VRSLVGRDAHGLYLGAVAVLAGAYYGAAKLGLTLAFANPSVAAVWPPAGIALAALILWGKRYWPGVAVGALLANGWTGVPIETVLGITVGNTLEALTGAYLLERVARFRSSLRRVRDVLALIVLGGAVSTLVAAAIGVASLRLGGAVSTDALGSTFRGWSHPTR
jgi:integral membrane sensor domain MASE1